MAKKQDVKPTKKQLVREITDELGIEVSSIYDWCFKKAPAGPYLTFQWYDSIFDDGEIVYFVDEFTEWAEKNRSTALPVQINRAYAVASLILDAYYKGAPLRVAVLDGITTMVGLRERDEAHLRELDPLPWYPHHRDEMGRIVVYRNVPQPSGFDAYLDDQARAEAKGQEAAPKKPIVTDTDGTAIYERDSSQVVAVKQRANGICERCEQEGFKTPQGRYLEAHHVIPLNCDGDDKEWNMVAICPNDHREAHYGANRDELRDWFITEVIAKHFPGDDELIDRLSEKSWRIRNNPQQFTRKMEDWVKD
ncbi:hypothetical protein LMG27952_07709 [Paraburkholderia hiiakae]|uniref:HNH nuclease domain-containing protein n=1 Tax=Paraburkholderia hiiakae TaxID=1081782 RepID=A0ABM8PBT7_9BURK|nr:HNH endonuclease [Paraburkholderia hiiakae]CAD6562185.1 hypothetical protein LMG27952_07709 [Paraburkholderia hiiakae]